MTSEKILPPVNPIEATRYVASKIGHYALYTEKGHRNVDFTRPTARSERDHINQLSLSTLGLAALLHVSDTDTIAHIDNLS